MDVARLGLAVDSSAVEKGTIELRQLTGAAGQASAAARQLAGASQVEAAGHRAAAAAAQVQTAALAAQNTVIRSSMAQRTMMIYQLNDVAVSLASGMNPAMVAMQQGSQILQGGLAPALRTIIDLVGGLVTKFGPLLALVGGLAILLQGLTNETNAVSGANVTLMDTALAVFESISNGMQSLLGPAITWLQTEWDNAVNQIFRDTAREVNAIIGVFVGAVDAIKAVWNNLPEALGYAIYEAAKSTVNGVIYMVREVQVQINKLMGWVDTQLLAVGAKPLGIRGDLAEYITMPNPYPAGRAPAEAAGAAFSAAMGRDYVGEWMGDIGARSQEIAAARNEMDQLGGSAAAANDNIKQVADDGLAKVADMGKQVLSTLSSGFADMFKGLLRGTTTLSEALSGLLGKLGDLFIDQGFNMLFNGLLGGLFGGGGGQWGVFGGFGGFAGMFGLPGMAGGGTVGRSGLTWVGEEGPELLRLPGGAQVIPNGPAVAMAANQNQLQAVSITIKVEGARGNSEIQQMVAAGVSQGIRGYDRQLPNRIQDIQMRTG